MVRLVTMNQELFWFLGRPAFQPVVPWDERAGPRKELHPCPLHHPDHRPFGRRTRSLHLAIPAIPLTNVMWSSFGDCLVDEKVMNYFLANRFTGINMRPVHFEDDGPANASVKYWELEVLGWAGMARLESGIRRKEYCPACGHQTYTAFENPGILIDTKQWDGSDFVMVWPMPRYVFVTDRVSHLVRECNFSGVDVIAIEELPIPRGFGPGGLRNWMPEERARSLGNVLDIY